MSAVDGPPEGRWKRWCLRADPLPLMLLAVAVLAWHSWVFRTPEVALNTLARIDHLPLGACLFGALAAARVAQLLLRNRCEAGGGPGPHRSPLSFSPWLVGAAAGAYLLVWSELPLRASVRVSRPWLDALADEALQAPASAGRLAGRQAGLYRVAGVEVIGQTVVLYLDGPGGTYGLARVPRATPDLIENRPTTDGYAHHADFPRRGNGDLVGRRIAGDWFAIYSYYWSVKVGWS